jgi:flavin prenyltransferase
LRIVVGISGASGVIHGMRLLERLHERSDVETHLILTRSGEKTLHLEMGLSAVDARKLAHYSYSLEDIGARLASGSFPTDAMAIAPCSIHTMSAIATGITDNLLVRAADVTLKERRPLVVVPRETPFTRATLQHLLALHDAGAVVLPASPGFYAAPKGVQQLVDFVAAKVLDAIGVEHDLITRWRGELGGAR